jgi:prepilin signal peptidase PulO-like enzyme (type II secretory pathway)
MTIFHYVGLLVIGWVVGTLINYLSDVLPVTRRFSGVACMHCEKPLGVLDFVLLKRCKSCGRGRKIRAWVVMALSLGMVWGLALYPLGKLGLWASLLLLLYFGVVAVIDIEYRIIMHPVSLVGAAVTLAIGTWQHGWQATLIGGGFGLGVMLAVYYFGILFTRWLAKMKKTETDEEGMGFGDVALTGVLGLLLGWPGIMGGLTLAVLLGGAGSLVVLVYALATKKFHSFMGIPYGPFLLLGAAILLFRPV